jgi:hypothetical protein
MTRRLTQTLIYLIQTDSSLPMARQLSSTRIVCALGSADGLFYFLGLVTTRISDTNVSEYVQVPSRIVHQDQARLTDILPGLHLADASIFISCAMSLAVFDISKYIENGVIVEPVHDNTTGTIRYDDVRSRKVPLTLQQSPQAIQMFH